MRNLIKCFDESKYTLIYRTSNEGNIGDGYFLVPNEDWNSTADPLFGKLHLFLTDIRENHVYLYLSKIDGTPQNLFTYPLADKHQFTAVK